MSTMKEGGFDGPLPPAIRPDGFPCHRRGGCDRHARCEHEGECVGVGLPPANALDHDYIDETAEFEYASVDPQPANALSRNRLDEIAEIVRALTYAEMVEFAGGLWSLRGQRKVNSETLPGILYAWARKKELASGYNESAPPAGERDCGAGRKPQPIDTAPTDRPILAFMLGRWRIAQWKANLPQKRPLPFWSADDLRVAVSRAHQPEWWAELPPSPPDAGA